MLQDGRLNQARLPLLPTLGPCLTLPLEVSGSSLVLRKKTSQENGENPGEKNAVKRSRPSDGSNGSAQALDLSEVEKISPHKSAQASRYIGQRRRILPGKEDSDHSGDQRRDIGRNGDPHAFHGLGEEVHANGYNAYTHEALLKQSILYEQVDRKKSGNDRSAEIDRDNRSRPVSDDWNDMEYTMKGYNTW